MASNPNDQCKHHFDELLPGLGFPDLDIDDMLLDPNLGLDKPEEDPFDEFGLPCGHNKPPGEEQQLPPFGLPWGNQADNPTNPEPEPNAVNPAEYCAAFWEHCLIWNAYIDVVVQKVLHGTNQCALTHQLKSAQWQLCNNPNVPAEDLAWMALMIWTVEW